MMDLSPGSKWRKLINDEFNQDRYKDFRNWYFKIFKDFELKEFKDNYYDYLSQIQSYVPFVKWFVKHFHNKVRTKIMVLQNKNWNTHNGGIIVSGRGGRGGNNMLPYQETNIPLIGDWTSVGKPRQLPAPPKKEDQPSSSLSSNKIISYKEVMVNEPQEQVLEYFQNPVTEKIIHIDDEDLSLTIV